MSSIASPRRTEAAGAAPALPAWLPDGLAALILTLLLVSFRPFQPESAAVEGGGDIVNQLGFGTLGCLSIAGMAMFASRQLIAALWGPWFLILLVFFGLSVMNAADPQAAARAASFTMIGAIAVSAVLVLPRDADGFAFVLSVAGFTVVGLCYLGLILLPDIAKHADEGFEAVHAGLWRGVFSHKNVAGPVMACLSFAGVYLFRRGWKRQGALLFLGAFVFMANTGSKTTAGLVPVAILLVMLPGLIGMRGLTRWLVGLALAGTAAATLGIVFVEPLRELAAQHLPDLTYTGRTALWQFAGEMIAQRPILGYGYESLWGTPLVTELDVPFDIDWDIRGIVHGHNGYLDVAVGMGLPAMAVAAMAFIAAPLSDHARAPKLSENVWIADFFMMAVLFTTLNAFLESFFFRRADPVWLFLLLGVFGLRLAARFPLTARAGR